VPRQPVCAGAEDSHRADLTSARAGEGPAWEVMQKAAAPHACPLATMPQTAVTFARAPAGRTPRPSRADRAYRLRGIRRARRLRRTHVLR
jgi:hypothetical protein